MTPCETQRVYVVDDDLSIREALSSLLRSAGHQATVFASAEDFLRFEREPGVACAIVDVRMPGMNGLELQRELAARRDDVPLIFITGHGDIPMAVHAVKAGAREFLAKPFNADQLLEAVQAALDHDRSQAGLRAERLSLARRFASLTPRQREVVPHVAAGLLNKQIAARLGIAEVTVKVHRRDLMRKMGATSVADLLHMLHRLEVPAQASSSQVRDPGAIDLRQRPADLNS
jgi:FixJ family two-component response regulator